MLPHDADPPQTARKPRRTSRWVRWSGGFVVLFMLMLLGPLSLLALGNETQRGPWWSAKRESSGQAPSPAAEPQAVVQVYAARLIGWRGAFGVHTWVATKPAGADAYTVHHVIGWRHYRGRSPVVTQRGTPDFYWFGAYPQKLVDIRGAQAGALIGRIEQAVTDYPYADRYAAWPGPNSNTFTAFIGRQVPELGLDLPPTAIGKDFLGNFTLFAPTPSGSGWQFSLFGILGLSLSRIEGVEVNLFGLAAGLDWSDPALRLPGLGKIPGPDS